MDRAEVGRRGEAVAARFYQKQGCLLVAHNYSLLVGEIDLILREPDGTLVFCEVKTRQPDSLTTPAEAVTPAKQRRILRTAQLYLQHTNQSDQLRWENGRNRHLPLPQDGAKGWALW